MNIHFPYTVTSIPIGVAFQYTICVLLIAKQYKKFQSRHRGCYQASFYDLSFCSPRSDMMFHALCIWLHQRLLGWFPTIRRTYRRLCNENVLTNHLYQCWLIVSMNTRNKIQWRFRQHNWLFQSGACIWNCRLKNDSCFVSTSMR